ncbi:type II toxin-antitoxin system prevent-host-death family antitoxin [Phenylobacterium sp.]|uniref:type II toxin-antitoxin system Phd/YefM family antitoxin n=1 Tax=Phenylobacterium sp. TaxID=1871053 RepID=UPI0025D1B229|nr:type II toxin-antitoxin system prevent-host-death family antitoxin [Phenylobacterium sp.]
MTRHSVVEAKNSLSDLIDRAMKGEDVVITRHGIAVVELKAVQPPPKLMTPGDVEWLRANLAPRRPGDDAGTLISKMRSDDEERLLRR